MRSLGRVVKASQQIPGSPYIVFANWQYRHILMNWLVFAARCGVENVLVVSYDRRLSRMLDRKGVLSALVPMRQGKKFLWWRLYVFQALCEAGVDFIHCDADAILLKNPEPELQRFPEADFIASPGTVHPAEVAKIQHFVACMGFFFLKSNPNASSLLAEALKLTPEAGTDQAAVNIALFQRVGEWHDLNLDWERVTKLEIKFILNTEAIRSKTSRELEVVVLPHTHFQRHYLGFAWDPYVVHPLANQKAGTKIDNLKALGLWAS